MAGVAFEYLSKIYSGGFSALSDLNLTIGDGELVVIVGPSGCGKSTLLRLLAGLEQPSSGLIRIGDAPVNSQSPQERNVAMVFQDYALYPTMTVRGNLAFPLKMRRMAESARRQRIDRVAEMLDLGGLLDRLPSQLSGGQRQRVAMGRALVREPSVFLLDEPLANLDAQLRAQVRAEIAELQRRTGSTMIYVTHDQVEAMTLGQRIAVLNRGVLQQTAPPRLLYDRPANTFVAGFIGNPPMNLITTRIEKSAGRYDLILGGDYLSLDTDRSPLALGKPIMVGIRPESIRLAGEVSPAFRARVDAVEFLGAETLLYFSLGSPPSPLIARFPGAQIFDRGAEIRLTVSFEDLRFFGPDGLALN